jgi:hypothetical protein
MALALAACSKTNFCKACDWLMVMQLLSWQLRPLRMLQGTPR